MAPRYFTVRERKDRSGWQVDIKKSFAGKRLRLNASSEPDAWAVGRDAIEKIRARGIEGLKEKEAGATLKSAYEIYERTHREKSKSHRDKVAKTGSILCARFTYLAVPPTDLLKWTQTIPGTETTKCMHVRYMKMFFRWVYRMGYLERDPSQGIPTPKAAVGRNIMTPDQMRTVLAVPMDDWLLASILLAGFAGLRTAEINRMHWEDIDTKTGQIHVRPGVMKDSGGYDQRIVDFTKPLTRRKDALKGSGKLVPFSVETFHERRTVVAKAIGLAAWPDNCLRHSFATYHLGMTGNPGTTAYQMGHTSPAMVQKVYAVPARRADWKAWWKL